MPENFAFYLMQIASCDSSNLLSSPFFVNVLFQTEEILGQFEQLHSVRFGKFLSKNYFSCQKQ